MHGNKPCLIVFFLLSQKKYNDKANYGNMYEHGCSFSIDECEINSLFNRYCIDVDKHWQVF